jgi:hypothetical protein
LKPIFEIDHHKPKPEERKSQCQVERVVWINSSSAYSRLQAVFPIGVTGKLCRTLGLFGWFVGSFSDAGFEPWGQRRLAEFDCLTSGLPPNFPFQVVLKNIQSQLVAAARVNNVPSW